MLLTVNACVINQNKTDPLMIEVDFFCSQEGSSWHYFTIIISLNYPSIFVFVFAFVHITKFPVINMNPPILNHIQDASQVQLQVQLHLKYSYISSTVTSQVIRVSQPSFLNR